MRDYQLETYLKQRLGNLYTEEILKEVQILLTKNPFNFNVDKYIRKYFI